MRPIALLLLLATASAAADAKTSVFAPGEHTTIDASHCISVRIESIPKSNKDFVVYAVNNCGANLG